MDTRKIRTGDRQPQRHRSGRKHKLRERHVRAIRKMHRTRGKIDRVRRAAIGDRDAAIAPPRSRLQFDLLRGRFTGQHRGQQHAVVGKPRLVTDHGDGIAAEGALRHFLDKARSRHAVSNDDKRFAHVTSSHQCLDQAASTKR